MERGGIISSSGKRAFVRRGRRGRQKLHGAKNFETAIKKKGGGRVEIEKQGGGSRNLVNWQQRFKEITTSKRTWRKKKTKKKRNYTKTHQKHNTTKKKRHTSMIPLMKEKTRKADPDRR